MVLFQVCSSANCNVQCLGSDRKIHSTHKMCKVGVPKVSDDINSGSFRTCASILLHSKVCWPRLDDFLNVILGFIPWLPHCVCYDFRTKRLQGAWHYLLNVVVVTNYIYIYICIWRCVLKCVIAFLFLFFWCRGRNKMRWETCWCCVLF